MIGMGNSIGHIWDNTVGAEEDRHNMENYESGPESGELTDSDSEVEKRNALIKSLVNVSRAKYSYCNEIEFTNRLAESLLLSLDVFL